MCDEKKSRIRVRASGRAMKIEGREALDANKEKISLTVFSQISGGATASSFP
jgi:hypothetical protein